MWFFFLIAVAGLVLSILVHGSTFFGVNPHRVFFPVIDGPFSLHIGMFPPFLAAIFFFRRVFGKAVGIWKAFTRYAPVWMRAMTRIFFLYAFFNFFFVSLHLNKNGSPRIMDGRPVLQNGGRVIRELTQAEYAKHQAYEIREFSGLWLVFYSAAMTMLYCCINKAIEPDTEPPEHRNEP